MLQQPRHPIGMYYAKSALSLAAVSFHSLAIASGRYAAHASRHMLAMSWQSMDDAIFSPTYYYYCCDGAWSDQIVV
eukprot:scaffold394485_cov32-Prasinocladus_malaysianus.AAC.2